MIENKNKKAVIIFIRFPVKGKVKTRLALSVEKEKAYHIYKILVENFLNECLKLDEEIYDLFIFCVEENRSDKNNFLIDKRFEMHLQNGDSLGDKMNNAFQKVFDLKYKQAILFGTDLPDLNSEILTHAFSILNKNDSVVGPAADGGFYLLGSKNIFRIFLME